jgi:hypothetical protein
MSEPARDEHIAPCGLFCTNCRKFHKGRCRGCQVEAGFTRCPVRACCGEKGITTCAECDEFETPRDYRECRKVNSFMARAFAFIFGSDRPGALAMLRDDGREAYLAAKQESGRM